MTLTNDDEDRREERREARLRALGTRTPRCMIDGCEEYDPFALTGAVPELLCREHDLLRRAQARVEEHHVAGQHNDPTTVPLAANDHAAASAHQALWPTGTLRNPRQSPLLRAAAWIRGWLDVLRVIIDRGIARIPAALEHLDELLSNLHGPEWWDQLGWSW